MSIDHNPELHRQRHRELHRALDELVADCISQTDCLPSKWTIMQLMEWSAKQADNPTNEHRLTANARLNTVASIKEDPMKL